MKIISPYHLILHYMCILIMLIKICVKNKMKEIPEIVSDLDHNL